MVKPVPCTGSHGLVGEEVSRVLSDMVTSQVAISTEPSDIESRCNLEGTFKHEITSDVLEVVHHSRLARVENQFS